ncbi:2-phosphosulfolactate phosphatase [Candidatus Bathyarchaeota archaeon]|nr:2-phosphosulfolactate phosphatase [Candidatus Bathyarchaeota archaeon]
MEILRLSLVEGSKEARGLTVVIDVFRAFSTAAYVMANGAEIIHPVGSLEEAFRLRELHPDWLLMGEREGKKVPGFDYGNSPYEVSGVDFTGRTVVQTTSAGTQGIVNAVGAEEMLLGSFVMADAVVEYIKRKNPETVSLVAMGWGGRVKSPEDESLAEYIEKRLNGLEPDFASMKQRIREHPQGAKFFDSEQPEFVEGDFHCAMDLNRFGFCLRVVPGDPPSVEKA